MKYLYLYLLLIIGHLSYAQDYPAFKFKTIKSQWDYFSIDTNYVKDNLNFQRTKYSNKYRGSFYKFKNNLYLLEFTVTPIQGISFDGYLLHSLDYKSGVLNWKMHNNYYNKSNPLSNFLQSEAFLKPSFTDDNKMTLFTKVSKDTIGIKDQTIFFYANYAKTEIDVNIGKILDIKIGYDTTRNILHANGGARNVPFINTDGQMGQIGYTYELNEGKTTEIARFYPIGADLIIDTNNVQSIEFPTDLPANEPIFNLALINIPLNRDTYLIFNTVPYLEDLDYNPEKATLRWIDISDREAIKEVHTLDIKPYYTLPDRNPYKEEPTVLTLDNNVIVSQRIFADKANPFKGTYWILWLDAKGNTLSSVRKLQVGTKVYELIYPYTVKGDRLYLMGEYADGNEKGIDLVEVHAGTNEVRTTTNLVSYQHFKNSRRIASEAAIWIDEEYSAFGFRMYKDTTRLQSEYFYYIGVRNQDLGIISSLQKVAQTIDCTIYPNPTVDQVTLSFGLGYTGTLRLHDVHGQAVTQPIKLRETDHYDLSLAELPSGVYYLQLDDGRGSTQVVGRPLIKM